MTATPSRLIVSIPVDQRRHLSTEIRTSADGKHSVTVSRWDDGRQLGPPGRCRQSERRSSICWLPR
jgi:hypothetical protein